MKLIIEQGSKNTLQEYKSKNFKNQKKILKQKETKSHNGRTL